MQSATKTSDEDARLASLHGLNLLDTPAEEHFDHITNCVKHYFNVSICLVSLVDSDRQWFKSKQGLDVCETDRSISFCGHAIQTNQVLVVEDTLHDSRFADNPLVLSAPNIRFYAGYPLSSDSGFRIGTLCIIDSQPRQLSDEQCTQLANFGKVVEGLIRQRCTEHLLKQHSAAEQSARPIPPSTFAGIKSRLSAAIISTAVALATLLLVVYSEHSALHHLIYALIGTGLAGLIYTLLRMPAKQNKLLQSLYASYRRDELRFKDAIEALPDGFVIFDSEQKIAAFNQRFVEMYQPMAEKITVGAHYKDLKTHSRSIGMLEVSNDIDDLAKQDPKRTVKLSDGRWIKITERTMQDGGIVGFHTDVTALKNYEQQLINAKQNAEQANKAKSRFLANISHEIRTPLNGILGLQDVLLDDDTLNTQQLFYLSTMQQSSHSLLQILNDILDVSKMEAGKLSLQPAPFTLDAELQSACDLMQANAYAKGLTFHVDIATNAASLHGDAGRIRQMVLNLLSNAIKFTSAGSVSIAAKCEQQSAGQAIVTIEVRDSGVGIEEHQVADLLQPFVQAENDTSKRTAGTGLGLTICNTLVQLMRGSLTLQRNSPQGTTAKLIFVLPLADLVPNKIQSMQPDIQAGLAHTRILLADDDETNQLVVATMLRQAKCIVDVVENGEQAVDAAMNNAYDIILMDIFMPQMDGINATKAIRRHPKGSVQPPIIAFTANAMSGDKDRFTEAGMDGYISKPVDKKQLLSVIAQYTSSLKVSN